MMRALRTTRGIGQRELAARAGTTQAQVSRIERDQVSPSVATLDRLFEAMGETVTLGHLSLSQPPPGGGNRSIAELRREYRRLTPSERLAEAARLSELTTSLAVRR
jgi:transcriptional regulator with XRE-family HTH domain